MHSLIENELFNNSIIIESQFVKVIQFLTPFGRDFDFNSPEIELDIKYKILDHKEDNRNHIVIIDFSILEKQESNTDNEHNCLLTIVVEGIYKINNNIPDKEVKSAKHFGSLNLLVNYLRTVFFNITSMTANGGQLLPLINLAELHKRNIEIKKSTKKNTTKKSTAKNKIEKK